MTSPVDENSLRDHRRTLGVRSSASADDINAAFRRMSKDAHPDAGGSLDRFTELQLARTELLQAVGSDDGPKVYFGTNERGREVGVIDRAPLWLPGAMATLVLGIISLVVGVTQVDRTVLAAGLLTAVAVGIAITGLLAIRRSRRTRR